MGAPVLIPAAVALRSAFNQLAPNRDKASDGWIGDTAHQHEVSDHNPDETGSVPIHDPDKVNEVHAVDVDNDLRESDLTMLAVVIFLVGRCRNGHERRLRYIIYDRTIWSASTDWTPARYGGPSPHTEHAHFSFSYDSAREADMSSWHLEDIPVALTPEDKKYIQSAIASGISAALTPIAAAVYAYGRSQRKPIESDTDRQNLLHAIGELIHGGDVPPAIPVN